MHIACVGWGSLVWKPQDLPLQLPWRDDGPTVGVEFARISLNGRLTLVLWPQAEPIRTYWALLSVGSLAEAQELLAAREECPARYIGTYAVGADGDADAPGNLAAWARAKGLAGAVWTALPSTFAMREGVPWSPEAAVRYLEGLTGEARTLAEEYLRKAPAQTRTRTRQLAEEQLGWTPL